MNKKYQIYGLFDPFTGELRYIGQTMAPLWSRLNAHVYCAKNKKANHNYNWIKSILNKNSRPDIGLIQELHNYGIFV